MLALPIEYSCAIRKSIPESLSFCNIDLLFFSYIHKRIVQGNRFFHALAAENRFCQFARHQAGPQSEASLSPNIPLLPGLYCSSMSNNARTCQIERFRPPQVRDQQERSLPGSPQFRLESGRSIASARYLREILNRIYYRNNMHAQKDAFCTFVFVALPGNLSG
jgi:hypothetical protein